MNSEFINLGEVQSQEKTKKLNPHTEPLLKTSKVLEMRSIDF